jgi:enoyl-CoA hydratase
MAATYLLPNAVGDAAARDLLLTGRAVDAEEALRLGLVSRVIADETFADDVLEIAVGIAGTAPIPSRYTKVALQGGGHRDFESALQWEALAQPITLATADLQEGVTAAREKRKPEFKGV